MCLDLLYAALREKEIAKLRAEAASQRPKASPGVIHAFWVNIFSDGTVSKTFPDKKTAETEASVITAANQNIRVIDTIRREVTLMAA